MNFGYNQLNMATRIGAVAVIAITINLFSLSDAFAQRGRGGGGGFRGGGGGSHMPSQAASRSPSMSRPAAPSQARAAAPRPSTGNVGNRAGAGATAGNRAATGAGAAGNRAGEASSRMAQGNPTRGDLNSFFGGGSQAAGTRTAGGGQRAASGNSAINDFFNHDASAATHSAAATQSAGSVANQRSENISNRTGARSEFRDSRGENREFASDNRQERVSDRGDNQAARVSTRGETRSTLAAGRGENRTERQTQRSEHADSIRQALEDEFDSNHVFDEFWKNNPQAYVNFHQNPVFWTWATLGTMNAFFGGGAAYSSGSSSEAYYQDGTVQDGEQQIPAEEYAAQAEEIVESAPEVKNPDDLEWLPLGVFVLAPDSDTKSTDAPTMLLQLAVSKEGIIAGNYNNKTTNEVKTIEGMVDVKSGRAAWTLAGKSTPIMETKVAGLTENETSVLVHFADGTTQQWLMAHLEKPAEGKSTEGK